MRLPEAVIYPSTVIRKRPEPLQLDMAYVKGSTFFLSCFDEIMLYRIRDLVAGHRP